MVHSSPALNKFGHILSRSIRFSVVTSSKSSFISRYCCCETTWKKWLWYFHYWWYFKCEYTVTLTYSALNNSNVETWEILEIHYYYTVVINRSKVHVHFVVKLFKIAYGLLNSIFVAPGNVKYLGNMLCYICYVPTL